MNTSLALYFDDNALLAAVEPADGTFRCLGRGEPERYALYFLVNDQGISYGQGFRDEFLAGDPRIIGDLYERLLDPDFSFQAHGYDRKAIDLLEPIISDLRRDYADYMATKMAEAPQASDRISLHLSFSKNVGQEARQLLRSWLKRQNFELPETDTPFSEGLFRWLHRSRQLPKDNGTYGLVEAVNDTLNLALVEINGDGIVRELAREKYAGLGADPRLGALSKFVVDEINRARNLLHTQDEREAEYRRQLPAAQGWNQQLLGTRRPFITIEAALSAFPDMPAHITLTRDKIDGLTKDRSWQVARFFETLVEPRLRWEDLSGVVILGNSMDNDFVRDGFAKFGKDSLMFLPDERVYDVLKGMLAPRHGEGGGIPGTGGKGRPGPIHIPDDLAPQDRIEFSWDPGRVVQASYLGQHRFVIIGHQNSSIKTGDSFRVSGLIEKGKKAMFKEVNRMGKVLGDYKTGIITSVRKL
ncbi:MAG: hypothetical protein D6722_12525 [Bacteroidetes bacterium]|nr:MAG: hypothetical protein D6722_12525 [Bacteroidota bacterium]